MYAINATCSVAIWDEFSKLAPMHKKSKHHNYSADLMFNAHFSWVGHSSSLWKNIDNIDLKYIICTF